MLISFVHQGSELYGSDRAFLDAVRAVASTAEPGSVEAVIPGDGPLAPLLREAGARVRTVPPWILRKRGLARLATVGLLALGPALVRAAARFRRSDLVYVNTVVVLDHLIVARFFPGRAIVHVHEAPAGLALRVLRALLLWSRAEIVFNSQATAAAYALPPGGGRHVVHNGVAGPERVSPPDYDGSRPLRVLLIGRINRDKGQDVLIEALARLPASVRDRIELRIVGSSFHDPELEADLRERVRSAALDRIVSFVPFTPDPSDHFVWADLVAVPSKTVESLGRVAIEAAAHGRPALVSRIGGLAEVVEDGRTGWLLPAGDAAAWSAALARIAESPADWSGVGAAGLARHAALFRPEIAAARIVGIVQDALARAGAGRAA